jgi:hypothetical protein
MQNKLNISLKPWETSRSASNALNASINSDLGGEGGGPAHHYVKVNLSSDLSVNLSFVVLIFSFFLSFCCYRSLDVWENSSSKSSFI